MAKFNKTVAKQLRDDLNRALKEIEEKYNIQAKVGNIRFSANELDTKIVFADVVETEEGKTVAMTKQAKEFCARARGLGLHENLLGETMRYEGKNYVITGYNTRASKNPMEFTVDGGRYKASVSYIKRVVKSARPEYIL